MPPTKHPNGGEALGRIAADLDWIKTAIRQLQAAQVQHTADLTVVRVEVSALRVKAGVWGLAGGAIPVAILLGVWAARAALS